VSWQTRLMRLEYLVYQTIPTTESYHYESSRSALQGAAVSLPPHQHSDLGTTMPMAADQTNMFPCDDPALMAQYLTAYPPLQPSRVMTVQPPSHREGMVYPSAPSVSKYSSSPETSNIAAGFGIQGHPHLMGVPVTSSAMQSPYSVDGEPQSFNGGGGVMAPPPISHTRYSSLQEFEVKDDPDSSKGQTTSVAFDLFPHQRTHPSRRGPFRDTFLRELTAQTRRMGSCIRCRMQRIRVCRFPPALGLNLTGVVLWGSWKTLY